MDRRRPAALGREAGDPRTVISTAFRSVRFGSLLLLFRGPAEAVGLRAGLQDVSAIGDSI
jgi:hypothetical protein